MNIQYTGLLLTAALVGLLSVSGPADAANILIDDFSDPVVAVGWAISNADPNPFVVQTPIPTPLPAVSERDLQVDVIGMPHMFSAVGTVGGGILASGSLIGNGSGVAVTTLQYDGLDAGSGLANAEKLSGVVGVGTDLTDSGVNLAFEIDFLSVDRVMEMAFEIHDSMGGSATYANPAIPAGMNFTHSVAFGAFAGVDLSKVSSIEMRFNGIANTPDLDFSIDEIRVVGPSVPEPSTAILAGIGVLGMLVTLSRRRRCDR